MTPAIPALLKKSRLDWWRTAALAVLWAETLVTVAWLPVTILAAGLGLALLGVLPGGLVFPLISLASLAAAAGLAATLAWRRLAPPDARAAERRLEHDSALPHRPFETLADAPAAGDQSLWQAHFDRAKSALTRLTLHAPRPGLPARDPLALRAMGALLLLAGLIAAGDQAGDRLARAFLPGLPSGGPAPLLQAWIQPPAYTGLGPILLHPGEQPPPIPFSSRLTISLTGGLFGPSISAPDGRFAFAAVGDSSWQATGLLRHTGTLRVSRLFGTLARWKITIIPNEKPVARFTATPGRAGKSLETALPWLVQQRWGVASLHAILAPEDADDAPAIDLPIPLPGTPKDATGTQRADLESHPYAGLPVDAHLTATDVSGQKADGPIIRFTLPARSFKNGLARAIIELRRRLALGTEKPPEAADDLQALTQAPAQFTGHAGIFLNTAAAAALLRENPTPAGIAEAQARLWTIALALDGALPEESSLALQRAQDQLRRALSERAQGRGSEDDVKRAMDQLRKALAQRLNDLARQAVKEGKLPPFDPRAQHFQAPALEQKLRDIEKALRDGNMQEARRRMEDLANLMEKLRNARVLSPQEAKQAEEARKEGKRQVGAVQDLAQREAGLMDHAEARTPRAPPSPFMLPNAPPPDPDQLEANEESRRQDATMQRALNQALKALRNAVTAGGNQVPQPLTDADRDMQAAAQALSAGQEHEARDREAAAVADLQKGGQQLAKQMQGGGNGQQLAIVPGNGQSDDEGEAEGEGGQGDQDNSDPLGRPLNPANHGLAQDDGSVKVPTEMEAARSRAIEEELRRRGANRARAREELEYINRLLKPY
jgi:uncharacterized protein (TIGR02302 family)